MADWLYTNVLHEPRKALGISVLEYCVLDYIYKTQTHPTYGKNGWTNAGCHRVAAFFDLSSGTVKKLFDRMDEAGLLERVANDMKRATEKFYSIAYESDVQKVNDYRSKSEQIGVQKVNSNRSKSEQYNKKNEIENKIEYKEPQKETSILKIHDQVDKTKVTVLDPMKDRTSKQLQFIAEVVEYLNKKTNQSFKATTKETIQNINGRVNVDRWELEDFKTVIDFKTNEWIKDDKMRQYLCPSTLFRASNAEKYLLAANAWKSKQKPQITPTHQRPAYREEKPVLTQSDIEASEAARLAALEVFKNMGVRI